MRDADKCVTHVLMEVLFDSTQVHEYNYSLFSIGEMWHYMLCTIHCIIHMSVYACYVFVATRSWAYITFHLHVN